MADLNPLMATIYEFLREKTVGKRMTILHLSTIMIPVNSEDRCHFYFDDAFKFSGCPIIRDNHNQIQTTQCTPEVVHCPMDNLLFPAASAHLKEKERLSQNRVQFEDLLTINDYLA